MVFGDHWKTVSLKVVSARGQSDTGDRPCRRVGPYCVRNQIQQQPLTMEWGRRGGAARTAQIDISTALSRLRNSPRAATRSLELSYANHQTTRHLFGKQT